jgi:tripartite-type tricarboxylate transporter receptor subunit TctC
LPALPDVPPLAAAAGLPALEDISTWIGVVAPAGTPRAIIDKIGEEIMKIYADPAVAQKLEKSGITTATSTPEEFAAFIATELARWGAVIKESGIEFN